MREKYLSIYVALTSCYGSVTTYVTAYRIEMLRHMFDFAAVKFQLSNFTLPAAKCTDSEESEATRPMCMGSESKVLMKCIGAGYSNLAKVTL